MRAPSLGESILHLRHHRCRHGADRDQGSAEQESGACLRRTEQHMQAPPIPALLGIHSDSGSESMKSQLIRYCHPERTTSPTASVSRAGSWRITEPETTARSVQSSTTLRGAQSSRISGILLMRGSVKTSVSSLLVLENSETIAPSGPAWNQWRVFGGMVYW